MSDYQQVERVAVVKGLNLRDVPDALEDGQWRRLTNVRSFAEGSVSTRPGRRWVAGYEDGKEVHTLCKLGEKIISGSGTALYRNGVPYPTTFSGRAISWVRHRASEGEERWLYVSDGTQLRMLAEDGSDIRWGINRPSRRCSFTLTTETGYLDSSSGTKYDWRFVFKNSRTGALSNPCDVEDNSLAVVRKKVLVQGDGSLDGQVDKIVIYRRGGLNGLDVWRQVGTVDNPGPDPVTGLPGTWSFTDNVPDAEAVGGFELRLDNDVPFTSADAQGNATTGAPFSFIWGPLDGKYLFAAGDPNRPGHVYWTNPNRPHSAGPANHIAVSPPDEPIMGGFVYGGLSYVWTRENLYALDFMGEDALIPFLPRRTFCGRGLSLPYAFAVGPLIWFFSKDGIYVCDGQSPAEPFTETDIRPLFNPQVEDRAYVAPGTLAEILWPPFTIGSNRKVVEAGPEGPSASQDFTVAVSSTSITAPIGGSVDLTTTVAATGTFWDYVELSVVPVSLPAGISYSFSPASGQPGGGSFASTLTMNVGQAAVTGIVRFQVKGKRAGGNLNHLSDIVTLTVTAGGGGGTGSFTIDMNASATSIAKGSTGSVYVLVNAESGFTGDVALSVAGPAGITFGLMSHTVTPPSQPVRLDMIVSNAAALGSDTVTVTATSGSTTKTASFLLTITPPSVPPPAEEYLSVLRMNYGGQFLHVHYKDVLGQWVHLLQALPYGRWTNDESPEIDGYGDVYETISYFDEEQANTALLIGTTTGLVALETGTYDYVPAQKIQCRVRDRSDHMGAPRTLKEFGNILVEADCGDAVLPAAIRPDQPTGISVIPFLDAETRMLGYQRIAGTGRQRFPRALSTSNGGEPVFGTSIGLDFQWNGNATLYGWTLQYHPDEELITEWAFGPTTHGMKGWQHVRDVYLTVRSNAALTPTVEVDGVEYPLYTNAASTTIPSTGGEKQKIHLWLPPVKGKVYRWKVVGQQFRIYGKECEIRVKEFNSALGYQLLNPFEGGSAEV